MTDRARSRTDSQASCYYNALAHIDDQRAGTSSTVLWRLAKLFVNHGVHNDFGISLLHRHGSIASDSIMVHKRDDPRTDICVEEKLGTRPIRPCSFLAHTRDEFVPFEYETTPPQTSTSSPLSPQFLLELGNFLWDHQLQTTLGLCIVSPLEDPWIETAFGDRGSTIAVRTSRSISALDGTITQWAFEADQRGDVSIKAVRACSESESGGHRRT